MSASPILSRPVHDELGAAIGPERLARLRERFALSLREAFSADDDSAEALAREAHTLISVSGMLGCERLSDACRALERAAREGSDLTGARAEIRGLRDATVAALEAVGGPAGPPA